VGPSGVYLTRHPCISSYEMYEAKFLSVLGQLQKLQQDDTASPIARKQMNDCLQIMLSVAACMRCALIHPVIPSGGRDVTVFFSPSRRQMPSVRKQLEKKDRCVYCKRKVKLCARKKRSDIDENMHEEMDDEDDEDDDISVEFLMEDDKDDDMVNEGKVARGTGEIVPIPRKMCRVGKMGIRHYACESCLKELQGKQKRCPRCKDLMERLGCDSGARKLRKIAKADHCISEELGTDNVHVPGDTYCEEIFGGFRASAKLEAILSNYATKLPQGDKALIVSFCKGSLDLLEAMFSVRHPELEVLRFDGDIKSVERDIVLEKFKTEPSCRVLLMTGERPNYVVTARR
jgi:SNF2 family DNA or RNA helicase